MKLEEVLFFLHKRAFSFPQKSKSNTGEKSELTVLNTFKYSISSSDRYSIDYMDAIIYTEQVYLHLTTMYLYPDLTETHLALTR